MSIPEACLTCAKKSCEQSQEESLEICEYQVAFYKTKNVILKKEALVPLRYVSYNLRHELNRYLNAIVEEAMKIDNNITSRIINLDNPASKILGTTLIIDNLIQMITGVNEFHPTDFPGGNVSKKRHIKEIIQKYFAIHSIIKNPRRAENLELIMKIDEDINISFCLDVFEYLVSILMDNIWKYSANKTKIEVTAIRKNKEFADIIFRNISAFIPNDIDIFSKGGKIDKESEGFGYGLYWAGILIYHYNRLSSKEKDILKISHDQERIDKDLWMQEFSLNNLIAKTK